MPPPVDDTTRLLRRYARGESEVEDELLAAVYDELRVLAKAHMKDLPAGHTLQPTALIHEAWLRLVRQEGLEFDARTQFYGLATKIMRSVLVDHTRRARREKRGGGALKLSLEGAVGTAAEAAPQPDVDLLALEEALTRLEDVEPELCRLVELRFFGGLKHPEIARSLGVSLRTVERNWRLARAWLQAELSK